MSGNAYRNQIQTLTWCRSQEVTFDILAQTVQNPSRQYPAPAPSPRHAREGPSVSDPYPHDAFSRRPAASPQASHLPRLGRDGRSSPRSVTSRLLLDFTGRWVSSSCFCAVPEGAASARVGVVPGSYSRHWWPVNGQTVTVPLSIYTGAGKRVGCKPRAPAALFETAQACFSQ